MEVYLSQSALKKCELRPIIFEMAIKVNLREANVHPIVSFLNGSKKINNFYTNFLAQLYTSLGIHFAQFICSHQFTEELAA